HTLPPWAPGQVLVVEVNLVRFEHPAARLNRQVVDEMKRLALLFQTENKVDDFRNHGSSARKRAASVCSASMVPGSHSTLSGVRPQPSACRSLGGRRAPTRGPHSTNPRRLRPPPWCYRRPVQAP